MTSAKDFETAKKSIVEPEFADLQVGSAGAMMAAPICPGQPDLRRLLGESFQSAPMRNAMEHLLRMPPMVSSSWTFLVETMPTETVR